mgnify:CR=1 FL=1
MSYNEEVISDHSQGMDRSHVFNSPEFSRGAIWDGLNMIYLRGQENPEKMRGFTRLGTTTMGSGTDRITGLFDYAEGTRLIAGVSDGKWYEYAGSDWAASSGATGYNTGIDVRWSFEMFYGLTTAAALLVGCNGVDAPEKYTSGAGASALGGSPPATGQFPVSWIGRLWMAAGDTLYGSAVNDCEKWGRASGGVEIQIDRGTGDITGLATFAGQLIIFKRQKILRIAPGTTLNVSDAVPVNQRIGTPSHQSIKEAVSTRSAVLMFMSDNGAEALIPTSATGAFYVRETSDSIQSILDRRSQVSLGTAWADFNPVRHEYYLTYGTKSATPHEGVVGNMARSSSSRMVRWTRHDMRNKTAGAMFRSSGEQIQTIGDTSGRVFKLHSGNDRNTGAYSGSIVTAAYNQQAPHKMKEYGRYLIDAETEGAYNVTCRAFLGRQGFSAPTSDTTMKSFGGGDGWGVGGWGTAVWGGSGTAGKYVRLKSVRRGSYIRLQIETIGSGQWFKFNQMMIESEYGAGVLSA